MKYVQENQKRDRERDLNMWKHWTAVKTLKENEALQQVNRQLTEEVRKLASQQPVRVLSTPDRRHLNKIIQTEDPTNQQHHQVKSHKPNKPLL